MATAFDRALWAERQPQLISMYGDGTPSSEIAAMFGCSHSQVCNQVAKLRRHGIITDVPVNAKVRFTPEMDAQLRIAITGGVSFKAYGKASGLSDTVVERRARDLGLKSAFSSRIDGTSVQAFLREGRQQGRSWRALAAEVGISDASARRLGRLAGLSMREVRPDTTRTAERIAELLGDNRTYAQIATALGLTREAVAGRVRLMRRNGRLPAVEPKPKVATIHRQKVAAPKARRAEVIGDGIKHNAACIGKKRLAAPRLKKPAKLRQKPKVVPKKREREEVKHLTDISKILAALKAPSGSGVSIVDLKNPMLPTQCRWPLLCDDGETRYCGESATDGSWCAHHGARVFAGKSRPSVDAEYAPRRRNRSFDRMAA